MASQGAFRVKAVISICLLTFAALICVAEEPEVEPAETGQVVFTSVARVPLETRNVADPSEVTEESAEAVARRWERLQCGRQHPWLEPLPFPSDIDEDLVTPLNPPATTATRGADPLTLFVNTEPSAVAPVTYRGTVPEPAVAASNGQVFYTANWYAATSSTLGQTFTFVNPYPGPFADPTGETFCCDQAVTHDPASNTIIWLQQFYRDSDASTDRGTQRINVDQNSDGSWDCAYDITTVGVGFGANTWFDFPDLAVSDNYLWHSSNVFNFNDYWVGTYAGRYPLGELSACTPNLTIDGYTDTTYFSFRFARGTSTTMYFAAHHSLSALRIFTWPDASAVPAATTVGIAGWSDQVRHCPGPDGREWCSGHDRRIQSGFVSGNVVGFMWVPSQNPSLPFPYTRISTFDSSAGLAHLEDIDIWSPDYAFVYPSTAVNREGALGGTIMWGGGTTHYPSCSAWMAEAPTSSALVPLVQQLAIAGTTGPSNTGGRSGDYLSASTYFPNDLQFVGTCFAYMTSIRGTGRFLHFGRASSTTDIFADGFESGGVTAWSASVP